MILNYLLLHTEVREITKMRGEMKMGNRFFSNIKLNFEELKGETIKNIESIPAEFGRTYDAYLLITCESDKRVLIYGGNPYKPNPKLKQMRRTTFFTPDEIAEKVRMEESERRKRKEREKERKRKEYERLKKELGIN